MKNNKGVEKDVNLALAHFLPFKFASECISLMERVQTDVSDIGGAYLFLGSNVLELYAKSYMCLRWEKEDNFEIEEINKRAFVFGHDLVHIYHYQGVGEDFLLAAGIKKVELFEQKGNTKKINCHYFEFYTNNNVIKVYPVDSLRYGVLAKRRNDAFIFEQIKLLNLCKSVRDAVITQALEKKFLK